MKIMSFNVLCWGKRDGHTMEHRAPLVAKLIKDEYPDIFGVQEAHIKWMNSLDESLGTIYAHVGIAREKDENEGEFSAVFFRKDEFDCVDSGTFWLSETPEVESKSWDSACTRICTWSVLADKNTGRCLAALNTHLDHVSEKARVEGIKLVVNKMKEFSGDMPVICMGDFNAFEDSEAYSIMTQSFGDVKYLAEKSDTGITFQDFHPDDPTLGTSPIDFIFVSSDRIGVKQYSIIRKLVEGELPSDHYPVTAEIEIN